MLSKGATGVRSEGKGPVERVERSGGVSLAGRLLSLNKETQGGFAVPRPWGYRGGGASFSLPSPAACRAKLSSACLGLGALSPPSARFLLPSHPVSASCHLHDPIRDTGRDGLAGGVR